MTTQPRRFLFVLWEGGGNVPPILGLARRLVERGHTVRVAETGRAALAAVAEERFDLVLMDVQMPEMDGTEATRAIREAEAALGRARTPIVALTANAFAEDRLQVMVAGMDDHLAKPVDRERLEGILARTAKGREGARDGTEQGAGTPRPLSQIL